MQEDERKNEQQVKGEVGCMLALTHAGYGEVATEG